MTQALQLSIEAHSGTPPAADWKRPLGRPRRTWLQCTNRLQQVEEDISRSVDAAQIASKIVRCGGRYDPQLVKRRSE